MKLLIAIVLSFIASVALAADVTATITVNKDGRPVFQQATSFYGMTDAEMNDLVKSGLKQVDFASRHQDKGGDYTIVWKWGDHPAVETGGMTFGGVNQTLKRGLQWTGEHHAKSEHKERQKKGKPWGN